MLYLSLFEAHSSPPKPYGYRWGVLLHNYENQIVNLPHRLPILGGRFFVAKLCELRMIKNSDTKLKNQR